MEIFRQYVARLRYIFGIHYVGNMVACPSDCNELGMYAIPENERDVCGFIYLFFKLLNTEFLEINRFLHI